MDIEFKNRLFNFIIHLLKDKKTESENHLKNIQEDVFEESKNSAGDKHETGRAMAQIECEKAANVLTENSLQLDFFQKIDVKRTCSTIQLGSLVLTSKGLFFISIGLGNFDFEDSTVFCMGKQAPLAQEMIGKKPGDSFQFRAEKIEILLLL